jgi:hypothetical protein
MEMPGFTAEASLRSRTMGYWMRQVASPAHSAVLPAAPPAKACGHICDLASQCNRLNSDSTLCQAYRYICYGVCAHPGGVDVGSAWAACMSACLTSAQRVTSNDLLICLHNC